MTKDTRFGFVCHKKPLSRRWIAEKKNILIRMSNVVWISQKTHGFLRFFRPPKKSWLLPGLVKIINNIPLETFKKPSSLWKFTTQSNHKQHCNIFPRKANDHYSQWCSGARAAFRHFFLNRNALRYFFKYAKKKSESIQK